MNWLRIKSVKRKLDILIGGLVMLLAIFIYFYVPQIVSNEKMKSMEDNAQSMTKISSIIVSAGLFFNDYDAIAEGIEPVLQDDNISFIVIVDASDSVYYAYNYRYANELTYNSNPQDQVTVKENDICSSYDIYLQNNYLGKIYLGYSLSTLKIKLNETKNTITIITILVMLIGLSLAGFLGRLVTSPLTKVVQTVNEIASGDLSKRAQVLTDDELGYLARSFNNMIDMIQNSQKELETKNEELSEEIAIRKIAEQNLKISENRFRLIFHKSNDFIFLSEILKNNRDKIIEVNEATSHLLGYTPKELYNLSHKDLLSPKVNPDDEFIETLLEEGSIIQESIYRTKDNIDIHVEINSNLFDLHGRKVILSVARDITDRREAEEALRESEERFRSIYYNATIGIYRTTYSGDVLMANPAIIEMLGYDSFEELREGRAFLEAYFAPNARDQFLKLAEQHNIVSGYEAIWTKKDKTKIYVRESARAVRDEEGKIKYLEGVVEDITRWKETEQALIEAKEKAEVSDKLKSEFLAQMSHEIRTPINTIMNFTSLLRMEMEDKIPEDLSGSFNSIENAANRLLRTINLVLNMSDIESGTYEARPGYLDIVDDILKPVCSEFARAAEIKSLDLLLTSNVKNNRVFIDNYTTTQIMANLVDNAIKYTDVGKVEIIVNDKDRHLEVLIKDSGIGIAKEYLPRLFHKFSQEEQGYTRRYEGNGLGLALVKEYCDINRADISVKSQKGIGTTFIVLLPRTNTSE